MRIQILILGFKGLGELGWEGDLLFQGKGWENVTSLRFF